MTPTFPALRVVCTTAAALVLAMAILFPAGPAGADSPEPSPATTPGTDAPAEDCGLVCLPVLGGGRPEPTGDERPTQAPAEAPAQPGNPAAEAPAGPQQAAASPATAAQAAVSSETDATEDAAPEGAVTETAAAVTGSAAPAVASGAPDWNTPITRSATATRAAGITPAAGPGAGGPELLPIAAGTLLMGAGGAAFIWWGRTRLRAH
ncbi:hypothetical protein [Arthrobacter nitrophenolicus]|uniref:Uncharacterized protein n=2 Tax=Arthrobacter nitrophenolicus TaxID=683150 RepID=L8TMF2_9MICC|nr:hypothetical protein [Arthrobacter nitrophenolicus]ELT42836.1 hypothetical protein G205_22056 [Arthrobacter nitrophenolicus]